MLSASGVLVAATDVAHGQYGTPAVVIVAICGGGAVLVVLVAGVLTWLIRRPAPWERQGR